MDIKVIEITRNETDWSVLVSLDGRPPLALTFQQADRPSPEQIQEAADRASATAAELVSSPTISEVSVEEKVRIVADLVDNIAFPLTQKPTDEEIRLAIERDAKT